MGISSSLLAIVSSPESAVRKAGKSPQSKGEPSAVVASSGPQRILIEVCCGPNSKLGDTSRRHAKGPGCIVIRITEQDDITSPKTRKRVIDQVNDVLRKHGPSVKILVWASIPCTGGSPWQRVNKHIPSAAVNEFGQAWLILSTRFVVRHRGSRSSGRMGVTTVSSKR